MTKTKVKRPTRDEFELEDLAERLVEAHQEESEVVLAVWGREESVRGRITEMDARTKMVHVSRAGEMVKVPFMDIMKVGSPE
ncbi:YolD-like family protein [Cohnella lubricantis]|uniref:YolD-like family protein n=1 Tax=Cohnella lubricantis TaxID=2163172 RepID=A0A841TBN4_9BACL|nr:YolD-like family protein [Cohnella lubricantis]MBB6677439.1 YolD-like family protein [Cohnella lubricantis]MBP2117513.1 hypothetical protein [Cohnella lubricantis]